MGESLKSLIVREIKFGNDSRPGGDFVRRDKKQATEEADNYEACCE
jgi:hypothetical protein